MSDDLKQNVKTMSYGGLGATAIIWIFSAFTSKDTAEAQIQAANAATLIKASDMIADSEVKLRQEIMTQFNILHGAIEGTRAAQLQTNERIDRVLEMKFTKGK